MELKIIILTLVILGLLVSLFVLLFKLKQQNNRFLLKEKKLLNKIIVFKKEQKILNQKVKLSEDFYSNYKKSRNQIAETIYEANLELLKNTFEKK